MTRYLKFVLPDGRTAFKVINPPKENPLKQSHIGLIAVAVVGVAVVGGWWYLSTHSSSSSVSSGDSTGSYSGGIPGGGTTDGGSVTTPSGGSVTSTGTATFYNPWASTGLPGVASSSSAFTQAPPSQLATGTNPATGVGTATKKIMMAS